MATNKKISDLEPLFSNTVDGENQLEILDQREIDPARQNKKISLDSVATYVEDRIDLTKTGIAMDSILAFHAIMKEGSGGIVHFDSTNKDNYGKCVGLSLNSATTTGTVRFVTEGSVDTGSPTLQAGKTYFADNTGRLTPVTPAEGIYQEIGYAQTSRQFYVKIGQPIELL